MLDISDCFKLNEDVVLKGLNGKYWALCTTTGNQYRLNEVAYCVLNELTESKSINDLVDTITKDYKVSKQEFMDDTIDLLEDALNNGLIEEVST